MSLSRRALLGATAATAAGALAPARAQNDSVTVCPWQRSASKVSIT